MNNIMQDLVRLRKEVEERLNAPGLPGQEKVELFVALHLIKKQIRTSKK